jgi:alpha-1,3-rhamnosyltransferase
MEKYIARALDSILVQEVSFDYLILVIDDGSTDNSVEIVNEFIQKYPDKIVLHKNSKNEKLLATIIKAYKLLKTSYWTVLDPDDYWTGTEKMQTAVDFLEDHSEYTLYAENYLIESEGSVKQAIYAGISDIAFENLGEVFPQTSSVIFRNVFNKTDLLKLDRFCNEKYASCFRGDFFRACYQLSKGRGYYYPKISSVYCMAGEGLWSTLTQYERDIKNVKACFIFSCFFNDNSFLQKTALESIQNFKAAYKNQIRQEELVELNNIRYKIKKCSPLVSVIIPAYNHEKYVQETINSIINQSYDNIELLIIDDGSTDETYQRICETEALCKKRFTRFVFERQSNSGTCETLNKLVEKSCGEYVYIIASDDVADPKAIEAELGFLELHDDYALCVGANDIIDAEGKHCFWDNERKNVYNEKDAVYFSFSDLLIKNIPHIDFFSDAFGRYSSFLRYFNHIPNGYLIRKSIFNQTGLFTKEAPLEDFWIMMQIAKYAKMKYLDDTLFYYRWHGANTIINTARMNEYTAQTLLYELRTVCPFLDNYLSCLTTENANLKIENTNLKTENFHLIAENSRLRIIENSRTYRYARKISKLIRKAMPSGSFRAKFIGALAKLILKLLKVLVHMLRRKK